MLHCMEHLNGWSIVAATKNSTVGVVIKFVNRQILNPFGPSRVILSDKALCFTAIALTTITQEI